MIESVVKVRSNADLIAEVARLWIKDDDLVIDLTYGLGKWWSKFRPQELVTNDLDPRRDTDYHFDFTDLPWAIRAPVFDVVAFDPPYIALGGRTTSTLHKTQGIGMNDRYALYGAPKSPKEQVRQNNLGILNASALLKKDGRLLFKCMDYISSGKYHHCLGWYVAYAERCGLRVEDLFIHHSGTGPMPKGRRQVHSRRSHSYLVVFQK